MPVLRLVLPTKVGGSYTLCIATNVRGIMDLRGINPNGPQGIQTRTLILSVAPNVVDGWPAKVTRPPLPGNFVTL